jgi:hypothetical protein
MQFGQSGLDSERMAEVHMVNGRHLEGAWWGGVAVSFLGLEVAASVALHSHECWALSRVRESQSC